MYKAKNDFIHSHLGNVTKNDEFEENKITKKVFEDGYLTKVVIQKPSKTTKKTKKKTSKK